MQDKVTTYYIPYDANGELPQAQQKKLGTPGFGYKSLAMAVRHMPAGGYVIERFSTQSDDWAGRVIAYCVAY